ncbi:unnamed protein product [Gordionus sp. m RMFG-2023]
MDLTGQNSLTCRDGYEYDDLDDLDAIIKEKEDLDTDLNIPTEQESENFQDINPVSSKQSPKKFGDYFKEASKMNPIGLISEDEFIDNGTKTPFQKNYKEANIDYDNDFSDIGKVKAKYYQTLKSSYGNTIDKKNVIEKNTIDKATVISYIEEKLDKKICKDCNDDIIVGSKEDDRSGRGKNFGLRESRINQKAFQPGSTPGYLGDHYLVWNSVGMIQSFADEDSQDYQNNTIEIEFFDKSIHHSMRLANKNDNISIADMSEQAVILAYQNSDDHTLKCLHFSSWDMNKEWEVTFPKGENIQAITLGHNWCAIATDARMIRIYHIVGIQRLPFYVPGDIVSLKGGDNLLAIIYTDSVNLYLYLYDVMNNATIMSDYKIPVPSKDSRNNKVTWIGGHIFSLLLDRGATWLSIANTKSIVKNKSDNYWIVSIQDDPSQIRAILCKGSNYPLTLPKPNVLILPFQLPLNEPDLEHTKLQNDYWLSWYTSRNKITEDDDEFKRAIANQSNHLIKLFALYCQTDKDFKAYEVCKMMPTLESAKLALKYATKSRKTILTKRLIQLIEENKFGSVFDNHTLFDNNVKFSNSEKLIKGHGLNNSAVYNESKIKRIYDPINVNLTPTIRVVNNETASYSMDYKGKNKSIDISKDYNNTKDSSEISTITHPNLENKKENFIRQTIFPPDKNAKFDSPNSRKLLPNPFKNTSKMTNSFSALEAIDKKLSLNEEDHHTKNIVNPKRKNKEVVKTNKPTKKKAVNSYDTVVNEDNTHETIVNDNVKRKKESQSSMGQTMLRFIFHDKKNSDEKVVIDDGEARDAISVDAVNLNTSKDGSSNNQDYQSNAELPSFQIWYKNNKSSLETQFNAIDINGENVPENFTKFAMKIYKRLLIK